MVHEKYTKKGRRTYGPYLYENKRVGEKIVTTYLGKSEHSQEGHKWKPVLALIVVLLVLLIVFFAFKGTLTGKVTADIENAVFRQGELLSGTTKFSLREGELIPQDAKVVVTNGNQAKELSLSDISIKPESAQGNFFAENSDISGYGKGYGVAGKRISYPILTFELLISSSNEQSGQSANETSTASQGAGENILNESPSPETPSSSSELTTSGEQSSVTQPTDEQATTTPTEDAQSSPTESSSLSGEGAGITGNAISENTYTISGEVSKDKPFSYTLEEGQTAEIVKGSVKIKESGEEVGDSLVTLDVNGKDLQASTDYQTTEEGFGQDFLGNNSLVLELDLSAAQLKAESDTLTIDLVYNGVEIAQATRTITILNETGQLQNETQSTNETVVNETLGNETIVNETLGNQTIEIKTTRARIKLGELVKWTKNVTLETPESASIGLPKEAENINVTAIKSGQENIVNTDTTGITGNAVLGGKLARGITGRAIDSGETSNMDSTQVALDDNATQYVITYETPAPTASEEDTANGKRVIIAAPSELNYTDVLAYTNISEVYSLGQEFSIKIYWEENNSYVLFDAYDLDGNGKIDYLEWNVPHLSNQTFDIILISKAEHLDSNRTFVGDVYGEVKTRDYNYAEIPVGDYLRVTFQKSLTNKNDITLYAKGNSSAVIEVYEKDSDEKIADFGAIGDDGMYKILLTNLANGHSQDTFDLKVIGSADSGVDFDYVVDPVDFGRPFPNSTHLNIQVTDASGNILTGTFDFKFVISNLSDCSFEIYSNSVNLTTDSRGIISYYLPSTNAVNWSSQNLYLCEYRDGVLKDNSIIGAVPYAYLSNNSNYLQGLTPQQIVSVYGSTGNVNRSSYWGNYLYSDYDMALILSYAYNHTLDSINYFLSNPLNWLNATTIDNATIARIGNCPDGQVVMNTTTGGVQCVPVSVAETDPIFVAENSTLWNAINGKLAETDQRYNETLLILSVNTTTNIMSLDFYNKSEIDTFIASAGNSSWNQTIADTLYYSIANPLNFINATTGQVFNDTTLILTVNSSLWSYISSNEAKWSSTYNATYDLWAYNQTTEANSYTNERIGANDSRWISTYNETYDAKLSYNATWNQSLADTLYYSIANPKGYINTSANATYATWAYNQTIEAINAIFNFNYYNSTTIPAYALLSEIFGFNYYNSSNLQNLSQLTNNLNFLNATTIDNATIARAGTYNCSAGQVFQNTTINSSGVFGQCITPIITETDPIAMANINANNSNWLSTLNSSYLTTETDSLALANINANNSAWLSTYNATYQLYSYNQTTEAISWVQGRNYLNTSANSSYLTTSANATYIMKDNTTIVFKDNLTYVTKDNSTYALNATFAGFLANGENSTIARTGNCPAGQVVMNTTTGGVQCVVAGNSSFNQSLADSLYYSATNPKGYINTSANATYDLWAYNQTTEAGTYTNERIAGNDSRWISTYNETYDAKVSDNATFNQSLTDNLYLNLSGGNANQNINIGGYNLTASNLFGLINWSWVQNAPAFITTAIIDLWTDNNANGLLLSNGTAIGYNETVLNSSISGAAAIALDNSTIARTGNCPDGQVVMNTTTGGVQCVTVSSGNLFDQTLNTTSNVTFNNITVSGTIKTNGFTINSNINGSGNVNTTGLIKTTGFTMSGNINGTGNITTTSYGFFGWLGSITSYVNSMFVTNITTNNITLTGTMNITNGGSSSYIYNNGSGLIIQG